MQTLSRHIQLQVVFPENFPVFVIIFVSLVLNRKVGLIYFNFKYITYSPDFCFVFDSITHNFLKIGTMFIQIIKRKKCNHYNHINIIKWMDKLMMACIQRSPTFQSFILCNTKADLLIQYLLNLDRYLLT